MHGICGVEEGGEAAVKFKTVCFACHAQSTSTTAMPAVRRVPAVGRAKNDSDYATSASDDDDVHRSSNG